MKLVEDVQDVMIGGAQDVEAFTIKASAKAFLILSANLYSNPLGSMIRELSTNAYDAHVVVGKKDVPFIITHPTAMDPTFKIRDFGPGLSHKDIMTIYTTFFESTKTNSNDVVGCLGLGSKSPFGIADSFTINSYFNGVKTIYSAFLNDTRIPTIAKFLEVETDEESGLEIEIAIKQADFKSVSKEIAQQLKYFNVKPIIKNKSDFEWLPADDYIYAGKDWKMLKSNGRYNNKAYVIQGQICYPIDTSSMGAIFSNAERGVKALLERNLLINVNIGDVNIAPSREALTYDDATCKNIISYAERILRELPDEINKAISTCETEYDARLKYYEISSDLSYGITTSVLDYVKWNGKDVSSIEIFLDEEDIIGAIKFYKSYNSRFKKSNYYLMIDHKNHVKDEDEKQRKFWEFRAKELDHVYWFHATESDTSVEARVKQFLNDNEHNQYYDANIIKTKLTPAQLADKLGLKESSILLVKDLPKVKRTNRVSHSNVITPVLNVTEFDLRRAAGYYSLVQTTSNKQVNALTELTGFYVDYSDRLVYESNGEVFSWFLNLIRGCVDLGIISNDAHIYGLGKLNKKKEHNLVNFFDYVRINVVGKFQNSSIKWGNGDIIRKLTSNMTFSKKLKEMINYDSPMLSIIDLLIQSQSTNSVALTAFGKQIISHFIEHEQVNDKEEECNNLDKLYPMFACVTYNWSDAVLIAEYINQMDTLRKLQHK